jgi:DNA-binding transcriptional ArsR family regulator
VRTLQSVLVTSIRELQPTLWRTCRVLANRIRLRMLRLLFKEPGLTVSAVAQRLDLSLPAASQSLRALEARALLVARRNGRWVHYQLPPLNAGGPVAELVAALRRGCQHDACPTETLFKLATAFTHPRRIEVFRALNQQSRDFRQIQTATGLSAWAVRRHLGKLEQRGFVVRQGSIYAPVPSGSAVGRALARWAAR